MTPDALSTARRVADRIVAAAGLVVPGERRADWRREWRAELHHRAAHAARQPPPARHAATSLLLRAAGAIVHATWLRVHHWRSTMFWQDARYAGRLLRRSPGFTLVACATLALGIGATTAMFSIAYAVLMKPLPYRQPDRLVQIWEHNPLKGWTDNIVAPANLLDWRARNRSFTGIAAYYGDIGKDAWVSKLALTGRGEPEMLRGLGVTGNFFSVLGVAPALGRSFGPADDDGEVRVAMLSDRLWRRRFAARPGIVGQAIELNGRAYTVVGVMPPAFHFGARDTEIWTPLGISPAELQRLRRPHFLRTVARLRDGASVAQAQADLTGIAGQLEREYPDTNRQMGVGVGPFQRWMVEDVQRPLLVFLAAVGVVLLVACVNVTNLLLARAAGRAREVAIRSALGAGRARLVRQLLVESLLIAALGTAIGLGLTVIVLRVFVEAGPEIPRLEEVAFDRSVFLASALIAAFTTVACGLAPAWHLTRPDLAGAIRDGGRGATGGVSGGRTRSVLVAAEVALTVVLVVGAGLLLRSFDKLQRVDPGVARTGVLTFAVSLNGVRYPKPDDRRDWFERLFARLAGVPGVRAVGATSQLPLAGAAWTGDMTIEGRAPDDYGIELRHKEVSRGFFAAVGLDLVAGRGFTATDTTDAPRVVVVNRALAERYFPRADPVGRRITFAKPTTKAPWRTIVGVVDNEPQDGLGKPARPEIYESIDQNPQSGLSVVVRTDLDAASLVPGVRAAVRELDATVVVQDVRTMDGLIAESLRAERFSTWLLSLSGAAALGLALIGVYGIVSYAVSQRAQELGVRLALGASRGDVLTLVLRRTLWPVAAGLVVGLGLALATSRVLAAQLFDVSPWDPTVFALTLTLLFLTALVASLVPARRASRLDPLKVLRLD